MNPFNNFSMQIYTPEMIDALEEELLVKFMDGNVKPQDEDGNFKHSEFGTGLPVKVEQPGYTELWKETVAREAGEVLKVKE